MRSWRNLCLFFLVFVLSGCGGTHPPGGAFIPGVALQATAVQPAAATIAVGATQQFRAIVTLTNGQTEDVTANVTWTTSSAAIATVNASGLASGVSVGTANISATFNGTSGSATLTVSGAPLKSIAVTPNPGNVPVGKTLQLTATGTNADGTTQDLTSKVTWSSSNTTLATIAATGIATGVAVGQCTITASLTSGNTTISGQATLNVTTSVGTRLYVSADPAGVGPRGPAPNGAVVTYTLDDNGVPQTPGVATSTNGPGVGQLLLNPAGTRLYCLNPGNPGAPSISTFSLNASGDITSSPVVTPIAGETGTEEGFAINAAGTILYTSDNATSDTNAFLLDANGDITGLSANSPAPNTDTEPTALVLSPNGANLYTCNQGHNDVTQLLLLASGDLTKPANENIFNDPNVAEPVAITTNASGSRLYVTNNGTHDLSVFQLDASGAFVATQGGSPFTAGLSPIGMTVNASGSQLYVADSGGAVLAFPLAGSGDVSGAAVSSPVSGGASPQSVALNPANTLLFATNGTGASTTFEVFTLDTNGNLGTVSTVALPAGVTRTVSAIVHP